MTTDNTDTLFAAIDNAIAWDQDFSASSRDGAYRLDTHGPARQWAGNDCPADHQDRDMQGTKVL